MLWRSSSITQMAAVTTRIQRRTGGTPDIDASSQLLPSIWDTHGHDNAVIVLFPDGTEGQAPAAGRPENDPEPLFGLYLDRCWEEFRPTWEHVILDWPDFGVPADLDGATIQIRS